MFYVNESKCVGCNACIESCPQGAINLRNDKAHIDQKLCTECGVCREICINGAIIEVKMPVHAVKSSWETPPMKVNKDISLSNLKQTKLISTIATIAPVVLDVISTYIQNRALKGTDRNERQCNHQGRGFGRRGRHGKRRKGPFYI